MVARSAAEQQLAGSSPACAGALPPSQPCQHTGTPRWPRQQRQCPCGSGRSGRCCPHNSARSAKPLIGRASRSPCAPEGQTAPTDRPSIPLRFPSASLHPALLLLLRGPGTHSAVALCQTISASQGKHSTVLHLLLHHCKTLWTDCSIPRQHKLSAILLSVPAHNRQADSTWATMLTRTAGAARARMRVYSHAGGTRAAAQPVFTINAMPHFCNQQQEIGTSFSISTGTIHRLPRLLHQARQCVHAVESSGRSPAK